MVKQYKLAKYQSIWQKYIEGDVNALSFIYLDLFDVLLNFGMKYSTDRHLVEDCIQNLFISLLKNRNKQIPVQNIKFYLIKGLKNIIALEQRKNKKIVPVENTDETDFRINYSIENTIIIQEKGELQAKFLKMVAESLSNRQKEALYLKYVCSFDYVQISELMQINVESVRTIVYRTLKTINKTFGTEKNSNIIFFIICQTMRVL